MQHTVENKHVERAFEALVNELESGDRKGVADAVKLAIRRTHRTHQQLFMKLVLVPALQQFAEGGSDLRNQASVSLAKTLLAAVVQEDIYLPFI